MKVALTSLISLSVFFGLWIASFILERRIGIRFKDLVRMIRALLLPCFAALWAVELVGGYGRDTRNSSLLRQL
jgi:hypothetical protein